MKVSSIPCEYLQACKKAIVTNEYLIILTGRSILILSKTFQLIKRIDGLKYAYEGMVSPDGKMLLIISSGANFYMLSLITLELLWKERVKEGKYCHLEGKGTWTLDGKCFLLIILDERTYTYTIRCYDAYDPLVYKDHNELATTYRIHEILSVPSLGLYILLKQDMLDIQFNLPPRPLMLMHYKKGQTEEYVLSSQIGIPMGMEYQENIGKLVVYTQDNTFLCDLDGENLREITMDFDIDSNTRNPFAYFSLTMMKQIALSLNKKFVYVASTVGFDICDSATGEPLFSKEFGFGAENFTEIEENMLIVCKYDGGASIYKITE